MATSGHPVCGAEIEFPRGSSIRTGLVKQKTKDRRPARPGKYAYHALFFERQNLKGHMTEELSKGKRKRNQVTRVFISRQGSKATVLSEHLSRFGATEFFTWGCCAGLYIPGTDCPDISKTGQICGSENKPKSIQWDDKGSKGVQAGLASPQPGLLGEFLNRVLASPCRGLRGELK